MNAESERADLNEVRFVTRAGRRPREGRKDGDGFGWGRENVRTIERQMSELNLVLAPSDEYIQIL